MRNASTESPIDDLTYDVITVLHAKAKALEAYDKYIGDAEDDDEARQVFEQIRREDEEHVRVLKEVLARRLDEDLGYADEGELDEEDEEDFEDEEEDDEGDIESRDASHAGEHRGEEVAHDGDEPPPRRGESTHRRGT